MAKKPTKPKRWPMSRWRELQDLKRLVCDVQSLNSGNCVIERIRRCVALARKLDRPSRGGRFRDSFVGWLEDMARAAEPPGPKPTEAAPDA